MRIVVNYQKNAQRRNPLKRGYVNSSQLLISEAVRVNGLSLPSWSLGGLVAIDLVYFRALAPLLQGSLLPESAQALELVYRALGQFVQ